MQVLMTFAVGKCNVREIVSNSGWRTWSHNLGFSVME